MSYRCYDSPFFSACCFFTRGNDVGTSWSSMDSMYDYTEDLCVCDSASRDSGSDLGFYDSCSNDTGSSVIL